MLIIDTNIWVSYALSNKGAVAQSLKAVLQKNSYAFSDHTFRELTEVLLREKFDPYFSRESRVKILKDIANAAEWFNPTEVITDCRDPKDNVFLELAVTCDPFAIITGDQDLLSLNPYRGIPILSLTDFVSPSSSVQN